MNVLSGPTFFVGFAIIVWASTGWLGTIIAF